MVNTLHRNAKSYTAEHRVYSRYKYVRNMLQNSTRSYTAENGGYLRFKYIHSE